MTDVVRRSYTGKFNVCAVQVREELNKAAQHIGFLAFLSLHDDGSRIHISKLCNFLI